MEGLGEEAPVSIRTLHNLAAVYVDLRDPRGEAMARRAVKLAAKAHGTGHPNYAMCLNGLAEALRRKGDWRAALPMYRKCRDIGLASGGPKSVIYTTALNNMGLAQQALGQLPKARTLFEEALRIRKATLGTRHPLYAITQHNLAGVLLDLGDYREAERMRREALATYKAAFGEHHAEYLMALSGLAEVYRLRGDLRAALPLYRRCAEEGKRWLGEKHVATTTAMHNLALVYSELGDLMLARGLYEAVLRVRKETIGTRHPMYAVTLDNYAGILAHLGRYREGLAASRQALATFREALGEKSMEYARALNGLGLSLLEAGMRKEALAEFEKALRAAEGLSGDKVLLLTTVWHNMGEAHMAGGDLGRARARFRQALAERMKSLGRLHPLTVVTEHRLAAAYARGNRPGAALVYAEEAAVASRTNLARNAGVLSERQQLLAAAGYRGPLDCRLSLPDEAPSLSHSHVLAFKGAVYGLQREARLFARLETQPEARATARALRVTARQLSAASSSRAPNADKRIAALTREKEDLEGKLSRLSAEFRAGRKGISSEQLRASLPEGVVLVDFLLYHGHDPSRPWRGEEKARLSAWVLRRDRATVRVELGLNAPVEKAVRTWRASLEAGEAASPAGADLRRLVWSPLEKRLRGAKAVLLSPDGPLARLPFAALPGARARFLLEEVPLAVVPVPLALAEKQAALDGPDSLLALGGVAYADGPGKWAPLPGTLAEADAIASQFRKLRGGKVASLAGRKATRSALLEALPNHRFAHLATHGYFAPPTVLSALASAATGKATREVTIAGLHPGLLSGLVLAGANRPTETDNGVLTALEVSELDLSKVDLAVLSACQTGLGMQAAGEGVLGLQRAFQMAGCQTVVSSLWSVHDAATAVLMERFYHHLWKGKLSKLEALRQAQLDVLRHPELVEEKAKKMRGTRGLRAVGKTSELIVGGKKQRRSPPAWWAAWQLSGDWR
jgi:CHAT domain-containing protein/tetratricopeptide (TPR) repeat protein